MTDAQAVDALSCILCGKAELAAVAAFIPTNDDMRVALLTLGALPAKDARALLFGVCRKHAKNLGKTAARVEALLVEAAAQVTVN